MFTPIKNKKLYEQVIEQIQNMIMNGQLKRGDKLPSERELAETLGVSRTSIREALRALEILGVIESRQGEGNFINGSIKSGFFEQLSIVFRLDEGSSLDVLDLRKIIEVEAAGLAAARITDKQSDELGKLIDEFEKAKNNEVESARLDKEIHYKIASITGNKLIVNLLETISSLMESFIKDARQKIQEKDETRMILVKQHKMICSAIMERNVEKSMKAMKEHLDYINNIYPDMIDS
ncbi:transcriptional regulator, GntR family [Peptoclostridium litorale DSM 5388]|uniref:Lactate-responsive regulator LldR, GntR family n=1 Tax=Peptoclostridium litorale DSM 5388 TaxID=1121324 RepID=A0A069RII1_PEPLI|nr:FadR/GntR family transcriptional regulator [Peptoclostridium litorale]KDR94047.1 lactate-responsive regulator LldR, GntR family [Peptoclostridium litorale DSM 5388]SIN80118.1 transcriptional regulator, GntR family [Peptoclostridium litorale DSM 5388]